MARRYVEHIAPFIDVDFWVTQEFGAPTSGGGTHKGIDIATIGSRPIYSISKGNVYYNQAPFYSGTEEVRRQS